ncbi:hypothetical protein J6590_096618, partial [Homalodisca vitripennis]
VCSPRGRSRPELCTRRRHGESAADSRVQQYCFQFLDDGSTEHRVFGGISTPDF